MAVPLPYQGYLSVPIEWTVDVSNVEMKTGSFAIRGTIGAKPYRDIATLLWILPVADGKVLLDTLANAKFNGAYEYTSQVHGTVKLRCLGAAGYTEPSSRMTTMNVTCSFERV